MPVHDELGCRMKEFYETIPKTRLMRRTPVAIRIDGKAFHTFTRGFRRPFDPVLARSMWDTMKYLCENIQGCVLGYTQSDEITLILTDYKTLSSDAWFGYEVQKMCSIAASMATMAFNKYFSANVSEFILSEDAKEAIERGLPKIPYIVDSYYCLTDDEKEYAQILLNAVKKGAMFDARCFNIPKEEVTNLIYWRQLDATRNSIQMVGQTYFNHKELQNKSCSNIQDMLMEQKGINWNNFPVCYKRGVCAIKVVKEVDLSPGEGVQYRSEWEIDTDIPIFKGEGREYIEELIWFNDGEGDESDE